MSATLEDDEPLRRGLLNRRRREPLRDGLARRRTARRHTTAPAIEDNSSIFEAAIAAAVLTFAVVLSMKLRARKLTFDEPTDDPLCLLPSVDPPTGKVVYGIQDEGNGLIKIGKASDATARRRQLQTGNPSRLRIVAWRTGYTTTESSIHRALASERVRGEWFLPSAKTINVLKG